MLCVVFWRKLHATALFASEWNPRELLFTLLPNTPSCAFPIRVAIMQAGSDCLHSSQLLWRLPLVSRKQFKQFKSPIFTPSLCYSQTHSLIKWNAGVLRKLELTYIATCIYKVKVKLLTKRACRVECNKVTKYTCVHLLPIGRTLSRWNNPNTI